MSKLLKCKINVMKIDKSRLFKGEKGVYLDLAIWIRDEPDKFGNDVSLQQETKNDEPKIFLGNGKTYKPKAAEPPVAKDEWQGKKEVSAMSGTDELPGADDPLPF